MLEVAIMIEGQSGLTWPRFQVTHNASSLVHWNPRHSLIVLKREWKSSNDCCNGWASTIWMD